MKKKSTQTVVRIIRKRTGAAKAVKYVSSEAARADLPRLKTVYSSDEYDFVIDDDVKVGNTTHFVAMPRKP